MSTDPAYDFLWQASLLFLLVGALMGVALGALLVFRPNWMVRLNHLANRWISTRHMNQVWDRYISVEQWFYRQHKVLGIVFVLGATYMFIYFGALFDKTVMLGLLNSMVPTALLDWLLDALVLSALVGAAAALVVGLFLWQRPSMLRDMEQEANRWVSSRRASKPLEIPRDDFDRYVIKHARQAGGLLSLASLYLFFLLFRLWVW